MQGPVSIKFDSTFCWRFLSKRRFNLKKNSQKSEYLKFLLFCIWIEANDVFVLYLYFYFGLHDLFFAIQLATSFRNTLYSFHWTHFILARTKTIDESRKTLPALEERSSHYARYLTDRNLAGRETRPATKRTGCRRKSFTISDRG